MVGDLWTSTKQPRVILVSMPWTSLTEPSLGLGILHATLEREGIPCRVRHLNIFMLQFLKESTYNALASVFALNDFVFSGILDGPPSNHQLRWLRQKARQLITLPHFMDNRHGGLEEVVEKILILRQETIPHWLSGCADQIAESEATLVGMTCMFDQTITSLALARLIRERTPDKMIAFGGYAVRSPTGKAVITAFPWVDVICDGEGDYVIAPLARASAGMMPLADVPGIVYRNQRGNVVCNAPPMPATLDKVPDPNYDNFFADTTELAIEHAVHIRVEHLPLENSRGCWWGAKSHCIFCGIKDSDLTYRARSAEYVIQSLDALSTRHNIKSFRFADYILPYQYYKSLLPKLATLGAPYSIVSETKANISTENFQLLARAGFTEIQPGIESFSMDVLSAMRKGVTPMQNIHTMMLGRRNGVYIHYNLIYAFPSDKECDYIESLALLPKLMHLDPPATRVPVQITRYAQLQTNPDNFGIERASHEPSYEIVFSKEFLAQSGFRLDDYCYYFQRTFANSVALEQLYGKINEIVDLWRIRQKQNTVWLYCKHTPDGVWIYDRRSDKEIVSRLTPIQAALIDLCEKPTLISDLESHFHLGIDNSIAMLEAAGLIYIEQGRMLSLVLPTPPQHSKETAALGDK